MSLTKTIKEKSIEWWKSLETKEQDDIEKKYEYFGHDIGINEDDILYFYESENKFNNK